MDPQVMLPNLVDPLARLTAVGTAITILTEVIKQYVPEERVAPPFIAGLFALIFTAVWEGSYAVEITRTDALQILLLWITLFQTSIAVYHGTKLSAQHTATRAARQKEAIHAHLRSLGILQPGAAGDGLPGDGPGSRDGDLGSGGPPA